MSPIIRVNADRTNATHAAACTWGQTPDGGMNRVALNDDDKSARDWFVSETGKYGCTHKIDQMGNIFAIRPGENNTIPPIALGSHLDTQPTGGKYDGILGVVCAVEVLKCVHENGIKTYAPLAVVNWTNEEGARFPQAMCSSGVWAEEFPLSYVYGLKDDKGITFESELKRIGYQGDVECSYRHNPLLAHFEVHIEQGPLLDSAEKPAAVVKGVESIKWFYITLTGRESHAGSTPMDERQDALLGAAKIIAAANKAVTDKSLESGKLGARATIAWIESSPQSPNTIAGKVKICLDLRTISDADMDVVVKQCEKDFENIATGTNLGFDMAHTWTSKAIDFDATMVDCIRASAREEEGCDMELVSHIGHDSVYTSRRIPTAMIFARCKNGISHNPNEYSRPEDCAVSAQVLLGAYLRYDERIREQYAK
ncbi:putative N-carbamoyl-L-amino acid hydrolase [Rhizodiscina lignyota]|uniref:N-carbamoyl-L-amino acid hydrolase n=1 Tax=Rhizodiscina lignyota TaxID=1504668 RepID=A0A9P4IB94_9PEZI|nr:putative N-carbamoyl-L-amino acid hydrolase [Rhizodiscina lignyota]